MSTEGQTKLVDDMAALVKVAQQHMPPRDTNAPKTDGLVFSVLDQFIEAIPDEHEQGELSIEEAPRPPKAVHPLHVSKGWPEKFTQDLGEPTGGEWLASFALALPVIESGGIILMHGKRGPGKTRMAAEIARAGRFPCDQTRGKKLEGNAEPRKSALYRTAMRFFLDIRATYKKDSPGTERDVIDQLTECGLLVLDELQERGDTPFEDRLLTHLIDARYGALRPTIIIANLDEAQLGASLGPSIVDRVHENGKRIEFTWASYRRAKR